MANSRSRTPRGVRARVPTGVIMGRLSPGGGAPEYLSIAQAAAALSGALLAPAGVGFSYPGAGITQLVAGASLSGGTITTTGTIAVAPITAGVVSSNGTILEATSLAGGLSWSAGTLSITAITAGLVSSNGTILEATSLAHGYAWSAGTLDTGATWTLTASSNQVQYTATGANTNLALTPTGTGYLSAQVANSGTAGGNARGTNAVDWQTVRNNATQVASGVNAVILGGSRNTASGTNSTAGGFSNTASGLYSLAIGEFNTASADGAAAIGILNTAIGTASIAFGNVNTANHTASIAIGSGNTSQGNGSVALGADNNATGANSTAVGQGAMASNTNSTAIGHKAFATGVDSVAVGNNLDDRLNTGGFITGGTSLGTTSGLNQGQSQRERWEFVSATTGSSAVRLTTTGAAAGARNVAALGNNSMALFTCEVAIFDKTTGVGWTYSLGPSVAGRVGSGNITMSAGNPSFVAGPSQGAPAALVAAPTIVADTTNQGFNISYTPPAGNTDDLRAVAYLYVRYVAGN